MKITNFEFDDPPTEDNDIQPPHHKIQNRKNED